MGLPGCPSIQDPGFWVRLGTGFEMALTWIKQFRNFGDEFGYEIIGVACASSKHINTPPTCTRNECLDFLPIRSPSVLEQYAVDIQKYTNSLK